MTLLRRYSRSRTETGEVTMNEAELAEMARSAFAQTEAESADAQRHAEYERLNAEAIRLHGLGYPYPPPSASSPIADAEAVELLRRAEALHDDVRSRKVGGINATQWLYASADIERELRNLMRDWLLPEEVVFRLGVLLGDLAGLPCDG